MYCPGEQETQSDRPLLSSSDVPDAHKLHVRSEVAVGAVDSSEPAGHPLTAEHFRSEVAVAGNDSYSVEVQLVR